MKHQHQVWFTYWSWQTDTSSHPWQSFLSLPPKIHFLLMSAERRENMAEQCCWVNQDPGHMTHHPGLRLSIKSLASIRSSQGKWSTNRLMWSSYLVFWRDLNALLCVRQLASMDIKRTIPTPLKYNMCKLQPSLNAKLSFSWESVRYFFFLHVPGAPANDVGLSDSENESIHVWEKLWSDS